MGFISLKTTERASSAHMKSALRKADISAMCPWLILGLLEIHRKSKAYFLGAKNESTSLWTKQRKNGFAVMLVKLIFKHPTFGARRHLHVGSQFPHLVVFFKKSHGILDFFPTVTIPSLGSLKQHLAMAARTSRMQTPADLARKHGEGALKHCDVSWQLTLDLWPYKQLVSRNFIKHYIFDCDLRSLLQQKLDDLCWVSRIIGSGSVAVEWASVQRRSCLYSQFNKRVLL